MQNYRQVSRPLGWSVKITLRRRHAHILRDGALSHNIDQVSYSFYILNLEERPNCTIGSKITAILQEYVNKRVRITPHFGSWEIVTCLGRVPKFLPAGIRHQTKG